MRRMAREDGVQVEGGKDADYLHLSGGNYGLDVPHFTVITPVLRGKMNKRLTQLYHLLLYCLVFDILVTLVDTRLGLVFLFAQVLVFVVLLSWSEL